MKRNPERLKFRAWDGKTMHYTVMVGGYTNTIGCAWRKETLRHPDGGVELWGNWVSLVGNEKIMQCVGLQDREGKYIYEGDILELPMFNRMGDPISPDRAVVVWNEYRFDILDEEAEEGVTWNERWWDCRKVDDLTPKVIGNVYEHPHLFRNPEIIRRFFG